MGYKFQFITLAGFHALNYTMFELAREYKAKGMAAYSRLQEDEFTSEREHGYEAVKHQRFVGTGYFDALQQVITGGTASTMALARSTEAAQFTTNGEHYDGKPGVSSTNEASFEEIPNPTVIASGHHDIELMPSGD
jgi:isocitrate lyase